MRLKLCGASIAARLQNRHKYELKTSRTRHPTASLDILLMNAVY